MVKKETNRERRQANFMNHPTRRQRREHRRLENNAKRQAFWAPLVEDMKAKRLRRAG